MDLVEQSDEVIETTSVKISVIGPEGVGKSSIINQICGIEFDIDIKCTSCYKIDQTEMEIDEHLTTIHFWDCGSYHFQSYNDVKNAFYRGSLFALLVFDATDINTINEQLEDWIDECQKFNIYQIFILINKIDTVDDVEFQKPSKGVSLGFSMDGEQIQMTNQNTGQLSDYESQIKRLIDPFNLRLYFGSAKIGEQGYKNIVLELIKGISNHKSRIKHPQFTGEQEIRFSTKKKDVDGFSLQKYHSYYRITSKQQLSNFQNEMYYFLKQG